MTELSGATPIPVPGNGRSPAQSLTPEDRLARIRSLMRDVPDFPKPGILFRDVTTVLRDPVAWRATVDQMCDAVDAWDFDVVVGVESRGFILGSAMAYQLGVGFVPVRKPGKLPAAVHVVDYQLEYGLDSLEIHKDALDPGHRVLVVDDLLATGGTAAATIALVEAAGGTVAGTCVLVELVDLGGRALLSSAAPHATFAALLTYCIDDDFLDPVHFRPDSVLGVPGILNAARAGAVTIANGVGNGVADDKAVYPYVPTIVRYYLGEEPLLPNVRTYDLRDPEQRAHVLPRLDRMVVKPVDGSGGYGIVVGSQASDAELATAAANIEADPRGWIAQPIVALSTSPTLVEGGKLAPRHLDLRPFAVNDGEKVWVLPGGLTRVALVEGSLVVNSSQGGGSKDTWVLDLGEDEPLPPLEPELVVESDEPTFSAAQRRAAIEARARVDQPTVHSERLRQQEMQQQQSPGAPTQEVGTC